jgi:hypothetical protein
MNSERNPNGAATKVRWSQKWSVKEMLNGNLKYNKAEIESARKYNEAVTK